VIAGCGARMLRGAQDLISHVRQLVKPMILIFRTGFLYYYLKAQGSATSICSQQRAEGIQKADESSHAKKAGEK
jgi:hypothetical protein